MGSLPKVVAGESYPVRESRGDQVAEPVMIRRARQRARQARATQAVPVAERLALATQVAVAVAPVRAGSPVDVLSTAVTVDQGEWGSHTAATPSVVNAGNAGVQTGDVLRVDVDTAGTGVKGLVVTVTVGP